MKAEASSHDELASIIAGENVELVYRDEKRKISDEVMLAKTQCENLGARTLVVSTKDGSGVGYARYYAGRFLEEQQ
jgi:hypothetical protein